MFSLKKLSLLAILIIFLLGLGQSELYAQSKKVTEQAEKFTLNGKVINNQSGEAVSEAKVYIVDRELKVETDKEGRFTFEKLSEGAHMLKIEKEGYKPWKRMIKVKEGLRVVLQIKPEDNE